MIPGSPVGPPACEGYQAVATDGSYLHVARVHCPGCAESASLRERLATAEAERDAAKHEAEMTLRQYRALLEQDEIEHEAALACEDFEARYVEVADAIGYVNRAEGLPGYAVADHATIMDAVRHLVSGEIDTAEFCQMATKLEAALADAAALREQLEHERASHGETIKLMRDYRRQMMGMEDTTNRAVAAEAERDELRGRLKATEEKRDWWHRLHGDATLALQAARAELDGNLAKRDAYLARLTEDDGSAAEGTPPGGTTP